MKWFLNLYKGRINRKYYLFMTLFVLGCSVLIRFAMDLIPNDAAFLWLGIFLLLIPIIFFSYSLQIRRLHDLGHSGWFALLMLVPIVSIFLTIYLFIAPGKKGANKYGPEQQF